jgi:hypothetical protein
MIDPFFTQKHCDRCLGELGIRTCSWFTEETICMDCSNKEQPIKQALMERNIALGLQGSGEGCGYVPDLRKIQNEI